MGGVWRDVDRQQAFFAKLEGLLSEFPEIVDRDVEELTDEILDGYDPSSPKMLTGLVVLVAHDNLADWSEMTVLHPRQQSHYMTTGMLHQALGMQ